MSRAIAILVTLFVPGLAGAQTDIAAQGITRVEIRCASGDVTVVSHQAPKVVVHGPTTHRKRRGDVLVLRAERGPLTIKMPVAELSVRVQSGDVDVTGDYPNIEVRTASGDVAVDVSSPEVELHSLSGGIRLGGRVQTARIEGVSGNIRVTANGLRELRAQATNGTLDVSAEVLPQRLDLVTMNGALSLSGALAEKADVRATSMSGSVTATLKGKRPYRLDARSYSGAITQGQESGRGRRLRTGSGEARVRLKSFSGDITVR